MRSELWECTKCAKTNPDINNLIQHALEAHVNQKPITLKQTKQTENKFQKEQKE